MNKFNFIKTITIYLRHITFIGFLYSGIIIYSSLKVEKFGLLFLILFVIYSLVTFLMFFIKSKKELGNLLNNIVVCILHLYIVLVSYKYVSSLGLVVVNQNFFPFSYLIGCVSMLVLIVNKFILLSSNE